MQKYTRKFATSLLTIKFKGFAQLKKKKLNVKYVVSFLTLTGN